MSEKKDKEYCERLFYSLNALLYRERSRNSIIFINTLFDSKECGTFHDLKNVREKTEKYLSRHSKNTLERIKKYEYDSYEKKICQ